MNTKDVDLFEKLGGQLQSVYDEIALISKKSPNDAVNKFKLGFVNGLLQAANRFLGVRYRPFESFEAFDSEALPSNSDTVFILGQYLQCFEKLRADNVEHSYGAWHWVLEPMPGQAPGDGGKIRLRTTRPQRLRE